MRSFTIRVFILVAAVLIAVIIGLQLHWMTRIYTFHENEFNTAVVKSVRGVYEDLPLDAVPAANLQDLVEKAGTNSWLFRTDSIPGADSLAFYLSREFADFNVFTGCRVSVYDRESGRYRYHFFLPATGSAAGKDSLFSPPSLKRNYSFVHLSFPYRKKYLLQQMETWIFASILLLLLLLGFAAALYYFFRQKFLVEVQRDFIQNVTHEFSTPLSVIELATDSLDKEAAMASERTKRNILSIRYQSDYLKKHIANLVSTVVTDAYSLQLEKKTVVPNFVLQKAALQLEPLLLKKQGRLVWLLEPGNEELPADEENLYLAFFNLLSNAIKYSERPVVEVTTSLRDHKYLITIRDNGIGISPADQKKIFRKFYRVQSGNIHTVKGLGLGLYFTRKVIRGHGGTLTVKSEPGAGSVFILELPITRSVHGK